MSTATQHPAVYQFLRDHPLGVLSTVDEHSKPWGSAVYCVVDENFNFYFVTRQGTAKFRNLEQNNHVALTFVDEASQTTVQVSGVIASVPIQQYMDIVFDKLAKLKPKDDDSWTPPLTKIHEGNYMPLHVKPLRLTYANFKQHKDDPKASYFEEII